MSILDKIGSAAENTRTGHADRPEGWRAYLHSDFVRSMPFWLPPTLLMGLFVYGGQGWNFLISLTDWTGIGDPNYSLSNLDFDAYVRMLTDPAFIDAFRNTAVLMIAFTFLTIVIGLGLAIVVDNLLRGTGVFRTIFLLPFALSFVVTGVFWTWMYNSEIGVINTSLRAFGLDFLAQSWLGDPRFKLAAVIVALVWQYSGYAMVVFLAGLRTIPDEHYEAAKTDGAGFFTMYRQVIIPQLGSAAVGIAVVVMVFALGAFTWLFVVFGRNPGPSADILGVMMYREAFAANNWAYGAAIGVVLFTMTLAILAPYLYYQYKRGEL